MAHLDYYSAFGLTIASEIPLDLPRVAGTDHGDLQIVRQALPEAVRSQAQSSTYTRLKDGGILCCIPSVALFLIHPAQSIVVDSERGVSPEHLQLYILGSVIAVVLHARYDLVLHASAVDIGGQAVVFCGPSGVGKSTLATAFLEAGFRVIADDITVIRFEPSGRPVVVPAYPNMRLWKSTLEMFQIGSQGLRQIRPDFEKFNRPFTESFSSAVCELGSVFTLTTGPVGEELRFNPRGGRGAYSALHNATYRVEFLSVIGDPVRHFSGCSRLASHIPVTAIRRPLEGILPTAIRDACLTYTEWKQAV